MKLALRSGMSSACANDPWWKRLVCRALDFVYPCRCAVCDESLRSGAALCQPCRSDLPRIVPPFCSSCGEMFEGAPETRAFSCPHCHDLKFAFQFARAATSRDPRTLDLIHRLKYNREIHLARELGGLAVEALADPRFATAVSECWPLVPVPLHSSRWRHRQFNQAGEIARILSGLTGNPVVAALRRTRNTRTQTSLSRQQRMNNLKGAFVPARAAAAWADHPPAGVILIDDVFTTGSTVHECARTLRKTGVRTIQVLTVMRG
ncbi:MAG: ComF family protein [Verrucomicrobiota bacterium]